MMLGALRVRHDPASAGFVRRQLACDLAYHDVPAAAIDDAVLVASELVGNAVRHTNPSVAGTLNVGWDVEASGVRVWVSDPSAEPPRRMAVSEQSTGGRGLAIVDAVSADWGVQPRPHGKWVWAFVLAAQRGHPAPDE